MSKENFSKIIKTKISDQALKYLLNKRGSKGQEMIYNRLEMAEYLMPSNNLINIEDKQNLFSIRNRMVNIENNFGKKRKCVVCEGSFPTKLLKRFLYTL